MLGQVRPKCLKDSDKGMKKLHLERHVVIILHSQQTLEPRGKMLTFLEKLDIKTNIASKSILAGMMALLTH